MHFDKNRLFSFALFLSPSLNEHAEEESKEKFEEWKKHGIKKNPQSHSVDGKISIAFDVKSNSGKNTNCTYVYNKFFSPMRKPNGWRSLYSLLMKTTHPIIHK